MVAMVAVGCEGGVMGEEEVCEGVKEVEGLRRLFGSVCGCVETMVRGRSSNKADKDTSLSEEEEGYFKTGLEEDDREVRLLSVETCSLWINSLCNLQ